MRHRGAARRSRGKEAAMAWLSARGAGRAALAVGAARTGHRLFVPAGAKHWHASLSAAVTGVGRGTTAGVSSPGAIWKSRRQRSAGGDPRHPFGRLWDAALAVIPAGASEAVS